MIPRANVLTVAGVARLRGRHSKALNSGEPSYVAAIVAFGSEANIYAVFAHAAVPLCVAEPLVQCVTRQSLVTRW